MIYILFLISIILEGVFSSVFKECIPFFTLLCILFLPYMLKDKKIMLYSLLCFGLIYDLMFTNALVLHALIYFFIYELVKKTKKNNLNLAKALITYYLIIIMYNIFMYLFTFIYFSNSLIYFCNIVLNSLFINTVYFLLAYLIFIKLNPFVCNTNKKYSYF